MGLSTDDIDTLSRDVFSECYISHSIYCGECGYNLRMLCYIGHCPECGNEYDARPGARKGVFVSTETRFPTTELIYTVFFLFWTAAFGITGFSPIVLWKVVYAFAFLVVGVISAYLFYRQLGRYVHFLWVARNIKHDDD